MSIKDALLHRLIQFYCEHADCTMEKQSNEIDDLIEQYIDVMAYVAKLASEYKEAR